MLKLLLCPCATMLRCPALLLQRNDSMPPTICPIGFFLRVKMLDVNLHCSKAALLLEDFSQLPS